MGGFRKNGGAPLFPKRTKNMRHFRAESPPFVVYLEKKAVPYADGKDCIPC